MVEGFEGLVVLELQPVRGSLLGLDSFEEVVVVSGWNLEVLLRRQEAVLAS